jgi:hypothetical protein
MIFCGSWRSARAKLGFAGKPNFTPELESTTSVITSPFDPSSEDVEPALLQLDSSVIGSLV